MDISGSSFFLFFPSVLLGSGRGMTGHSGSLSLICSMLLSDELAL